MAKIQRGADEPIIRITSEDQAWRLLEDGLDQRFDSNVRPKFVWAGWPNFHIDLPETPVHGSISPTMMAAFIELQTSIYRSHTLLSSGTDDLRRLSKFEKDHFEFRVKVDKGSSHYSIDLQEIAGKLGADIIAKMTGPELVITVLGVSLIVAGAVSFKWYLNNRLALRKSQTEDENTKALLSTYQTQQLNDTKRFELLTATLKSQPVLSEVEKVSERSKAEITSAVAEEPGGANVAGIEISQDVAEALTTTTRQQSADTTIKRKFRVAKVDTTVADGFRVTLRDYHGSEISASLLDALISREHRDLLQKAEWRKKYVTVEVKGRKLRDRVVDAKIVSVQDLDE
ncbi:MAG: hypothetical protein ACK4UO_14655 [Pseudolabrys sp.]